MSERLPDYVLTNRADGTDANAEFADAHGRRAWAQTEIAWGIFGVPEKQVGVLGDVSDLDVIELGCGICNTPLATLCSPDAEEAAGDRLVRPQRGLHRIDWSDGPIEFHLGHGDMVRLLRETGFAVECLVELFAAEDAETHQHYDYITAEWAGEWPAEELWVARKNV